MEDIIALLITTTTLTVGSIWIFGKTAFGQAIARRIESGAKSTDTEDIDALQDEVSQLREQNAEILERLDFTERLLTRARNVTPPGQKVVSGEN